jgi:hypothetical protein
LTVGTSHADVINKGSVQASMFHHKTGFPWATSTLHYFNPDNANVTKTYHPVLDTENGLTLELVE